MQQTKEPHSSVCWRVKDSSLTWLREQARKQDRPVSWVVNKLIEQAQSKSAPAA